MLTSTQIALIPRSNLSRWKYESDSKYLHSDINEIIKQEIEFIKRMNQSSKIKKINQSYFQLCDTCHEVISNIKGGKTILKQQKEIIVNTIQKVKKFIPIDKALKVFNISRATF